MENESMDCCETVDFYPHSYGASEIEEEQSKLRWIIDAGLSLGKKVAITGFLVTSAPLILPPLLVVSALGCAFSVPFGVVFASYACTQKLMSKLLPPSPPPPLLSPYGENEEDEMEDVKNGIEFVDYDESLDGGDGFGIGYTEENDGGYVDSVEIGGLNEEEIKKQESVDEYVYFDDRKIDDYGGDLEFQGQDNVVSSDKDDILVENEGEIFFSEPIDSEDLLRIRDDTVVGNEGEKNVSERIESEDLLLVGGGTLVENEGEMNVSERIEDLVQVQGDTLDENDGEKNVPERIDSGDLLQVHDDTLVENEGVKNVSERIESEDVLQVQGDTLVENEGEKNVLQTKESDELVQIQNDTSVENEGDENVSEKIGSEDLVQVQDDIVVETEGDKNVLEKIGSEDLVQDQNAGVEMTTVATVRVADKDEKRRKGKRGKKKTVAALKVPEKTKEQEVDNQHEKVSGEDKEVMVEKNETSSENNFKLGEKLFPEVVVQEESRDKLGSGKEQVGEEKSIVLEGENLDVKQVPLEKEDEPVMLKETSDVISVGTNGETISYKSTTVVVASETAEGNSVKIADDDSVEGMNDDKEIWKKIDAIRVIVGFKAPRCASYFEELKAMYIFTGIEPPPESSVDCSPSDSAADFRNKLRFLMSVIGLK